MFQPPDIKSSKCRHILSSRPRLEQSAQVVWFPSVPLGNQSRFAVRLLIFAPAAYKNCEYRYDDGNHGYSARRQSYSKGLLVFATKPTIICNNGVYISS